MNCIDRFGGGKKLSGELDIPNCKLTVSNNTVKFILKKKGLGSWDNFFYKESAVSPLPVKRLKLP